MSSKTSTTLRDFVTLQRGTTYKGSLLGLPGPALLGLASIQPNGGFRRGSFKTYGGESPPKITLRSGDLYVSLKDVTQSGDLLGSVARIPADIKLGRLTQDTVKLEFFGDGISRDYVYWLLRTPVYREYCRARGTGTTTLGLGRDDFLDFPVQVPGKSALSLVELLEALDEYIALLNAINTTLEAIAQAMFKSWFVDLDPVRAKMEGRAPAGMDEVTSALFPNDFDVTESRTLPKGWRNSTLGSICAEHDGAIQTGPFGSQLHASDYLAEGIPVVMPQDIQTRRVKVDKIARISESDANRLSRHQLQPGDIVFSRRGDVGRHALVGEREAGWLCGTGCLLVRPGAAWPSPTYLSLALDRTEAKDWLLRRAVGATMPNLNTGILSDVPIMWPESSVLAAFDNYVRVLDERVSHGHACIRSLTKIRDSLLPRLISGQLQLPDAEQFTAALKAA